RYGSDGASYLPATSFTYGGDHGSGYYPNGAWNRLTRVDNGQGGTLAFAYEDVGAAIAKTALRNYRRVTSRTAAESVATPAVSGTWTYAYGTPELNTLGAILDPGNGNEVQDYPNSAGLYMNTRWSPGTDLTYQL